ncbi:MAG: hypothetical protein ACRCY5_07345 [Phocaeicola sp.]
MKIDIEKQDERIENFLKGKMSPNEAKEFKEELKGDKDLRDRAIVLTLLIKAMQSVGAAEDNALIHEIHSSETLPESLRSATNTEGLESISMKDDTSLSNTHSPLEKGSSNKSCPMGEPTEVIGKFRGRLISIAVAAAVVVCALFITDYQLAKLNTQSLATECLVYAPSLALTTGELRGDRANEEQIESELVSLFEGVKQNQNREETIKRLSEIYLLASAERVNDYSDYMEIVGYYLSIAYMQNNDREHAKQILSEIAANQPHGASASELLEKLSAVKGLW